MHAERIGLELASSYELDSHSPVAVGLTDWLAARYGQSRNFDAKDMVKFDFKG